MPSKDLSTMIEDQKLKLKHIFKIKELYIALKNENTAMA